MIPILYEKTETAFSSNGLGRLSDCIRCIATEERNGVYECEFDYPVTGVLFSEIQEGRIIACTHDEQGDVQPFDIYRHTEPINGVVTFYAHHISYRLSEITVKPFTAGSCAEALQKIKSQSVNSNPFTFWTNKSVTASLISDVPKNAKNMLVGEEGSILDVYGTGEYEYDKFAVKLHLHRGQDTNVSIRYGKNLIDYNNDYDTSDTYTAVVPYWLGEVMEEGAEESTQVLVMLPELFITSGHSVPSGREVVVPMDLSDEFEDAPTVAELRTRAQSRLASSDAWLPNQTVTVDFVQLWQTEEYADYAPLQRLRLCDTCGVFVPMYDTALRLKIIRVTYNVLLDRYDEMELGDKPTTYTAVLEKMYDSKVAGVEAGLKSIAVDIQTAQQVAINTASADATAKANAAEQSAVNTASADATTKANNAKTQAISSANSYTDGQIASTKSTIEADYEQAIEDATELIRGGTGGYVVTTVNANGQPIELLITDNLNLSQAVNVWRWNQGGLAHSSNGYNGPFNDVAITADGKINASMILTGALTANLITTGTMSADRISGGTLWLGGNNDINGSIVIADANSNEIIHQDRYGITAISTAYVRPSSTHDGYYPAVSLGPFGLSLYTPATRSFSSLSDENFVGELRGAGSNQGTPTIRLAAGQEGASSIYATNGIMSVSFTPRTSNGFTYYSRVTGELYVSDESYFANNVTVRGSLAVTGTKPRLIKTQNYGERLNYCYETPTPLFGDIGEAQLDADGICYVNIDDIFSETIELRQEYQVFLQKEGEGDCWIAEKQKRYFVIQGTPNLKVAWELKAKQRDYDMIRLEQPDNGLDEYEHTTDADSLLDAYINEQEEILYGND